MQADNHARYARILAADAGRYASDETKLGADKKRTELFKSLAGTRRHILKATMARRRAMQESLKRIAVLSMVLANFNT